MVEPLARDDAVEVVEEALRKAWLAAVLLEHALVEAEPVERGERALRDSLLCGVLVKLSKPAREALPATAARVGIRNPGNQAR